MEIRISILGMVNREQEENAIEYAEMVMKEG